jgi:heme/copper-type cytochrome/quinol oxidase subunit 2
MFDTSSTDPNDGDGSENSDDSSDGDGGMSTMWRIFIYVGVIALLFGAIAVAGWWFIIARRRDEDEDEEQDKIESDTRP